MQLLRQAARRSSYSAFLDRQRYAARSFSRQSGSSSRKPADALAERRMRDEQRREALLARTG